MSGHSKWHNIQKTKGAADAKRSQIFTKIAREMIVAVKTGGSGDPANNSRLAAVIAKAKAANMPNDNIKRTIDKALGAGNTDNFESVVYEGYGPNGVAIIVDALTDNRNRTAAIIVDALTDNRNRTAPEVRHLLDKYGKGLGATGCVSWSFDKKGVIVLDAEDLDEDTVMMDALECGADDMQAEDEVFEIYTDPDAFNSVVAALEQKGYTFLAEGVYLPGGLRADGPPELCEAHQRRGHQEHGEASGVPGGQRRRAERLPQLGAGLSPAEPRNQNKNRDRVFLMKGRARSLSVFQSDILTVQ